MPLVVDVPLNTALADLDESLRTLLKRELKRHGFEEVDIAFDAPSREWSGKLTRPTVNLFLYDLREDAERASALGAETRTNGDARMSLPPLALELTYSVTAWTKAVEDEHRMLSQVLAILFSYKELPADVLTSRADGSTLRDVETAVGRPREEKADFWTSVGGQYKASIDYISRILVESGGVIVRGPEVRVQTMRTRLADAPARAMSEMIRFGGTVSDGDGEPIANAWVALPELGQWTSTDGDGHFTFRRVQPGKISVLARTADGDEASVTVTIPDERADLVIGAKSAAKKKAKS